MTGALNEFDEPADHSDKATEEKHSDKAKGLYKGNDADSESVLVSVVADLETYPAHVVFWPELAIRYYGPPQLVSGYLESLLAQDWGLILIERKLDSTATSHVGV